MFFYFTMILTLLRMFLTPLVLFFLIKGEVYLFYSVLIFTMAAVTDFFDGYLARKYNVISDIGSFLDAFADKILIMSVFFTFYYLGLIKLWIVLIILLRDLLVTVLRIKMLEKCYCLKTSYFAKAKTVSQFFVIYLIFIVLILDFLITAPNLKIIGFFSINILMYFVVIITILSGIDYLVKNRSCILLLLKRKDHGKR